jgi:hypothetical protein
VGEGQRQNQSLSRFYYQREEVVMKILNSVIALAVMLAFASLVPLARADEFDQATKLTFSQSVEIPGRVLPAGSYWFTLIDHGSDLNVVQIFNSDRSKLVATLLTNDSERSEPTDNTDITLAERGSTQPKAIVDWFYPGLTTGHEFVYPTRHEREELASAEHQTIEARPPALRQTLLAAN